MVGVKLLARHNVVLAQVSLVLSRLLVALPAQLSSLCDGQLTTSISFQKQVFIKTSQGPW